MLLIFFAVNSFLRRFILCEWNLYAKKETERHLLNLKKENEKKKPKHCQTKDISISVGE